MVSRRSVVPPEQELLRPFFSEVEAFLDVLKKTSSVVVGSAVVHAVLKDPNWGVDDLEVVSSYVSNEECDSSLVMFNQYCVSQGYVATSVNVVDEERSERLQQPPLSAFFKGNIDGKTVSFRQQATADWFVPVFRAAWATHMYTFATHESIYCMFPQLTIELRQSVASEGFDLLSRVWRYRQRGFTFVQARNLDGLAECCGRRTFGDSNTLRLPFSSGPGGEVDLLSGLKITGEDFTMIKI